VTRLALLCALLAALLVAPAALARNGDDGLRDERGIVQTVGAKWLELRTLDGAIVSIRADGHTRVTVNRRRASLADVRRGFVAVVRIDSRGVARDVQAFGDARDGPKSGGGGKQNRGKGSRHGDDTR
jgi:hypothetical protein